MSNLTKKLEEQRWNTLDDSWDSNSSWESWESHTDYSGSYIYSDDGRSSNTETNSPFQLSLPPFLSTLSDPLGLSSSITVQSNTTNTDSLPSTSLSTTALPSFTNIGANSHSQDDTLSASENSDNSDRIRRRQNQRLVSERPYTDTSQNRSLLDAYTSLGIVVEEAIRDSAQNVLQSRYPLESVLETGSSPPPRDGILSYSSSARVDHTIFQSNPSSPSEPTTDTALCGIQRSRSRSRSSEGSRNSLTSHRSSNHPSRRHSESYDHSINNRSVSSESDYWHAARSLVRSRSVEHSFHSDTGSSENYDRRRSRSCSTRSSDYFSRTPKTSKYPTRSRSECSERNKLESSDHTVRSRSKSYGHSTRSRSRSYDCSSRSRSKSYDRSTRSRSSSYDRSSRSRSKSYDHSTRSRSRSYDRSTRSRSKSYDRSTRSRSKSSEHSWSRSSQNSVRSWLRYLNHSRSRSRSSEHSGKCKSQLSNTRSRSRSSEHSGRKICRSNYRSSRSVRRKSWQSESSYLSDSNSNRSLSSHSHRKQYWSDHSRNPSGSQYPGGIKSSDYLSRNSGKSLSEISDSCLSKSFQMSRHSTRGRSHSPAKTVLLAREVFSDSSSSESEASNSRLIHSPKYAKKRFRSVSRNNRKRKSDVKSNSSNSSSQSHKRSSKRLKRDGVSPSSSDSTILTRNLGSVAVEGNLENSKSTKQQSVPIMKKSLLSESEKRQLKNCSQNSNKSADKFPTSNSKKKSHSIGTNSLVKKNSDATTCNSSSTDNCKQPGIPNVSATSVSHTAMMSSSTDDQDNNTHHVVCNGNPKKRKKDTEHDSTDAGKTNRVTTLSSENRRTGGDTAKVNVEIHLSVLNFPGDFPNRTTASNTGTGKSRSFNKTKCSSDVTGKKSTESNQKINETHNVLDIPNGETQSTTLRNASKDDPNNTNGTSNSCVAYSFRKSTVDKVLTQSSKEQAETSREGTRRSFRQVKPCKTTASNPILPSYFMEEDSDDSWTPSGLHEDSDPSLSESDSTMSDSSYEVQVPKPLTQIIDEIIDEMLEGDESDKSWTPDS